MCGIAGIIQYNGQQVIPEKLARNMLQTISHRGPDDEGVISWIDSLFGDMMQGFLNDKTIADNHSLDMAYCRSSFNDFLKNNRPYSPAYWKWFCLFLWHKICIQNNFVRF